MKRIEIYSSKKGTFVASLGAVGFIAVGLIMLIHPSIFLEPLEPGALFIRGLGLISILFFGYCLFYIQRRFLKTDLVLVIDQNGVYPNPEKSPTDFIAWKNIVRISEFVASRQHLVVIEVDNPDEWIRKEPSKIRQNLLKLSISICGSPFSFSANTHQMSHIELMQTLSTYLTQYNETRR
jgi:hypothetical protein